MPDTAIDTNILLDLLLDDAEHYDLSMRALEDASRVGRLIIGPATLAELACAFGRGRRDLGGVPGFLEDSGIQVTPLTDEAAVTAGLAFAAHLGKRRQGVACAQCGKHTQSCSSC